MKYSIMRYDKFISYISESISEYDNIKFINNVINCDYDDIVSDINDHLIELIDNRFEIQTYVVFIDTFGLPNESYINYDYCEPSFNLVLKSPINETNLVDDYSFKRLIKYMSNRLSVNRMTIDSEIDFYMDDIDDVIKVSNGKFEIDYMEYDYITLNFILDAKYRIKPSDIIGYKKFDDGYIKNDSIYITTNLNSLFVNLFTNTIAKKTTLLHDNKDISNISNSIYKDIDRITKAKYNNLDKNIVLDIISKAIVYNTRFNYFSNIFRLEYTLVNTSDVLDDIKIDIHISGDMLEYINYSMNGFYDLVLQYCRENINNINFDDLYNTNLHEYSLKYMNDMLNDAINKNNMS